MLQFKSLIITVCLLAVGYAAGTVFAQSDSHSGGHDHAAVGTGAPKQQGQAAFAAIAEIVGLLDADPKTDWQTVNINALQQHLTEMNALTHFAEVNVAKLTDGARFEVKGKGRTLNAIHNMIPAHAAELNKMQQWSATASTNLTGAVFVVTSPTPEIVRKIQGLGFFGLMATGAHHQPHHLAIATGKPMH